MKLFKFPMSDRISTLLQNMPCLETLQLSHSSASHDSYGDHLEVMLVVPASVQRVELINVFPKSLVLDSNRTVVRLIGAVCCLQEALMGWADVRGQLKGLRLHQRADELPYSVDPMDESELWDRVEVLQFMRAPASPVDVNPHGLPRASLGNLTSLHVTMANLCIAVPALPGLKDLRLDCTRTLCMSFEDARVSAESLVGFEFVFATICVDNTISLFFATLGAAGEVCAFQQYTKMQKRLGHHDETSHKEDRQPRFHRMQYGSYRVVASSDPWEDLFTACDAKGVWLARALA